MKDERETLQYERSSFIPHPSSLLLCRCNFACATLCFSLLRDNGSLR